MVTIAAPTPLVMKDVSFIVGADDFKAHVSGVELVPSSSRVTWKGLAGNSYSEASAPTWDLRIAYVQDWDLPGSLSRYLMTQSGQKKAIELRPRAGSGPRFKTNAVIVPGPIGGDVDAVAAPTVTLGCDGPQLVEAFAVTTKALATNVATLTTSSAHGYIVGDSIIVLGVDATFDGTYTLTAVTSTTLSYAKVATNVTSTAATGTVSKA